MKTFNVKVYTGPAQVKDIAALVQLDAGTEHVYGTVDADDAGEAFDIVKARFQSASLASYVRRESDVRVSEWEAPEQLGRGSGVAERFPTAQFKVR